MRLKKALFKNRVIVEKVNKCKNKSGWKLNIKCPVCNFRKKNILKRTI